MSKISKCLLSSYNAKLVTGGLPRNTSSTLFIQIPEQDNKSTELVKKKCMMNFAKYSKSTFVVSKIGRSGARIEAAIVNIVSQKKRVSQHNTPKKLNLKFRRKLTSLSEFIQSVINWIIPALKQWYSFLGTEI